jgi:ligand-binding sensor domain-containing protein
MAQPAPGAIHRLVPSGDLLYAVTPDGVYVVDAAAGFQPAVDREPGQLSDRNISALAIDRLGRLWVGYFDRGLDVLSADGERLVHVENDYVFCVNRIVHDADSDTTAVATANGLVLFDAAGRERQRLGRPDGLIASHVTDLVLRRGGMTLATPAGITFMDTDGTRSLYAFHGLVSNQVYALAAAGDQLVAGTLGGLSVLDGGAVRTSYTIANSGLTHNWITAVVRVGDEWFAGTYGGSVVRLDAEGRPSGFADLPGQMEINPNAMAVTATHVFAGTLARGLLVYDRASGRWSTFDTGLPSVNVTALAAGTDDLYIGTDNGIVRVPYARLERP